jgi:hypothetical protein
MLYKELPHFFIELSLYLKLLFISQFCKNLDSVKPMTWKQYFVTPWADSLEQEEKVD